MSNSALGRKFTCHSCTTKFYDLNKPEPKCPKCGARAEMPVTEHTGRASRAGGRRGRVAAVYEPKKVVHEEGPAFDEEEPAPPFEDDEAAFEEDEEAAFEDDAAAAEGEEEPAAEEEEP